MKILAWLLMACSLASAIPLYEGESWTWLVVDRSTNAHSWRSAKVLSSAKHDSGVVWRIQARDSLTGLSDTAHLLDWPDGSQNWMGYSVLLPWEPQALSEGKIRGQESGSAHDTARVSLWGEAFMAQLTGFGDAAGYLTSQVYGFYFSDLGDDNNFRVSDWYRGCHGSYAEGDYTTINCPDQSWDDHLGLVRARFAGNSEWILQAHDDKQALPAPDSVKVPDSGSVMVWREELDSNFNLYNYATGIRSQRIYERRWEIVGRPADSLGWKRVRIKENLHMDSQNTESEFDLRLNPMTGERLPSRESGSSGPSSPDEGWWLDWTDSLSNGERYRIFKWAVGNGNISTSGNNESQWTKIGASGQMDSMNASGQSFRICYCEMMDQYNRSSTFIRTLISVDGVAYRSSSIGGTKPAHGLAKSASFAILASRYPTVSVKWRDATGRSGQMAAGQLLRGAASRGVLLVAGIFPDGSKWEGAWLPTGR